MEGALFTIIAGLFRSSDIEESVQERARDYVCKLNLALFSYHVRGFSGWISIYRSPESVYLDLLCEHVS